jgi:hypothetical protein
MPDALMFNALMSDASIQNERGHVLSIKCGEHAPFILIGLNLARLDRI